MIVRTRFSVAENAAIVNLKNSQTFYRPRLLDSKCLDINYVLAFSSLNL